MNKGAKSFVGVSVIAVPAIVGFSIITGSTMMLGGLGGVFVVLSLANMLDRKRS